MLDSKFRSYHRDLEDEGIVKSFGDNICGVCLEKDIEIKKLDRYDCDHKFCNECTEEIYYNQPMLTDISGWSIYKCPACERVPPLCEPYFDDN